MTSGIVSGRDRRLWRLAPYASARREPGGQPRHSYRVCWCVRRVARDSSQWINPSTAVPASNKAGSPLANTARLRRTSLEQRILAEIETEILSDEALERVKRELQSIFGRVGSNEQERSASPKLAKLEEEAQELRTLVKKGRLSSVAAQAALDAIERERAELVFHASRDERRVYEEAMKVIPQSAALYRAAVRDLNSTLKDPTERAEARALIAELLGRQVRIRQDGGAVFACLEIDEAVLRNKSG